MSANQWAAADEDPRRQAIQAAQDALAAEAVAKQAGEKLQALLAQEKKRVEELKAQTRGAKIVPDVTTN